jgi:hypothetical protein
MATNKKIDESKVSFRKSGSDIYFSIKGDDREYLIDLGSEARVVTLGPDLNELIWAIERAWRKEIA